MKRRNFVIKFLTVPLVLYCCACAANNNLVDDPYLTTLPPGFLPFEEFAREFDLHAVSTEQLHPITKTLSQTMHKSIPDGLELLLAVDEKVINGLEAFIPTIESLAPILAEKIRKGGRIFLIGSGSSGRVAVDIAAKCIQAFPKVKSQIRGMIAGGDSALIRAKEGFEDSEADGRRVFENDGLGPNDSVILISASGSASFNVGCGHFAAEKGAQVFYFYNSKGVPVRTQNLFDRSVNPVVSLCVDIGPQAIAGSTRLQAATLTEAAIGALLVSTLYLHAGNAFLAEEFLKQLLSNMRQGISLIRKHLTSIARYVAMEKDVLSDPLSNFRRLRDVTDQGYITFIASEDSIREVLIDSTETSPTFSTNLIRREGEGLKKRAEFRAYLVGHKNNEDAWRALLGREIFPEDIKDTQTFLLSFNAEGENSYLNRPKGKGNILIGVAKIKNSEQVSKEILCALMEAQEQGGQTGLLLFCRGVLAKEQAKNLSEIADAVCVMENVPYDAEGISETVILKQILNLISNGCMVLMNKIHGNQMIDVRASNRKLIARCLSLLKEIWNEYQPKINFNDNELYHYIAHVSALKNDYEARGIYTPSVVKILLAMLYLNLTPADFQDIVDILAEQEERIDWIGT